MSDRNTKIIIAFLGAAALFWFLTRTRQGNAIVNKTGELFPAIAPYLPSYVGGDVIIKLEAPRNEPAALPIVANKKSDCNMCGVSDNVNNLLPAGELAKMGMLSGAQIINSINWYGETDALYKIAMNADPDLLLIEPK